VNAPGTTLAVEVDTYSSPATSYPVAYGVDQPWSPYVTITTPSNAPSVTWTFMIIVRNTPVIDGKMALQIIGQAQVVDSHFLGRTYDLTQRSHAAHRLLSTTVHPEFAYSRIARIDLQSHLRLSGRNLA